MFFESETLLASARRSHRTLPEEWQFGAHEARQASEAGLPKEYMAERPRATRQSPLKHLRPEYSPSGLHRGVERDAWAPDRATRFETTMRGSYGEEEPGQKPRAKNERMYAPGPTTYPRKQYPHMPTAAEELRHLSVTNERRVDGDRTTEVLPAGEWLMREDANRFEMTGVDGRSVSPKLPRHSQRDHLSDRNRKHALFDPAHPEITTTVRVTRRQTLEGNSAQQRRDALAKDRQAEKGREIMLRQQAERTAREAAEANELLELYSMGIRGMLGRAESGDPAASAASGGSGLAASNAAGRSPIQTRSKTAHFAPTAPPAAGGERSMAPSAPATRSASRASSDASSVPPSNRMAPPQAFKAPVAPSDDLSWVTSGPIGPRAITPAPPKTPVKPLFPPGAFDIQKPDAKKAHDTALKRAPMRASG